MWRMKEEFLTLLPDTVQAKVDVIERALGREIDIRRDTMDRYRGNNQTPPLGICICDESQSPGRVEIVLSPDAVVHNIIHEVLHAYRVVALRVPQLACPTNPGANIVGALENDAEHLFIVPEEIALAGEAASFWEREESGRFDSLNQQLLGLRFNVSEALAVRHGLLRLWLFVSHVLPGWNRREELHETLRRFDWHSDAEALVESVNGPHRAKAVVLRALLQSGGLSLEHFRLLSWGATQLMRL